MLLLVESLLGLSYILLGRALLLLFHSDFLNPPFSSEVNEQNDRNDASDRQQYHKYNNDDCGDLETAFLEAVCRLGNALLSKFVTTLCCTLIAVCTALPLIKSTVARKTVRGDSRAGLEGDRSGIHIATLALRTGPVVLTSDHKLNSNKLWLDRNPVCHLRQPGDYQALISHSRKPCVLRLARYPS